MACDREHTATTFHVGTLDALADGHLLAVDSRQVQDRVATECPHRFDDFVGGTVEARRLSMLRAVWFTPTVRQSDRGADWYRCDLIALARNETLAPLTVKLGGVLGTPEGAGPLRHVRHRRARRRRLRTRHLLRPALLARDLDLHLRRREVPRRAEGPQDAGETACEEAGRGAAEDALNFQWGYEWPTEKQWDAGQTYGLCWAPD